MASEAGRELEYQHWDKDNLVKALMQAEDDIKALTKLLDEANEERGQYYQESRSSAKILGGILRVMAENDMFISGLGPLIREGELPDVAPNLARAAARDRRFARVDESVVQVHRYAGKNGIWDLCACGAQWMVQAERCASMPVRL